MKEIKECKIIQDFLLPNYIENLTDEETNSYIENHLKNCSECSQILEDMKLDIEQNKINTEKHKIQFLKKVKNKMLFLKLTIFIILFIIFLTFSITTIRKMIIISDLSNKNQQYENSTNYCITSNDYFEGGLSQEKRFYLGDKVKLVQTAIVDGEVSTHTFIGKIDSELSLQFNGTMYSSQITYIELGDRKFAVRERTILPVGNFHNDFYTKNIFDLFNFAIHTSIKETTLNGKECYYIDRLNEQPYNPIYFDKSSGLQYGIVVSDILTTSKYEFDTLTEDDLAEPDLSEYEVYDNFEDFFKAINN